MIEKDISKVATMSNLENTTPIELSEEQLEQVSGGIDIFISASSFEQTNTSSFPSTSFPPSKNSSISQSSHISSSAFQIIGLGFDSASDVMSFVKGFMKFFS